MKMTSQITITKQITADSLILDQVENTYTASFPIDERRSFNLIKELIVNNSAFSLYTFLKDKQYLGFITIWEFTDFLYVEHFAIESTQRSGGIGSLTLSKLMESATKPFILEVEPPLDDMSKRRIEFYKRHGFNLDSHNYKQPPYMEGLNWLDLQLMSYGEIDLESSFEMVRDTLYKEVYQVRA